MQTPDDVCPAPAVPPARLAWRVAVEREIGTWDSKWAMWFLVTQPFLSFDLVGSLPQIPSPTQIHCHTCTQSECASSLPARRRIRSRRCHSIGSERLGLPPELGDAVINQLSWIRLCTSTTCVICFMTSIFCTAFSRRFPGVHRLVLDSIWSRWRRNCCWCSRTCIRFSLFITW